MSAASLTPPMVEEQSPTRRAVADAIGALLENLSNAATLPERARYLSVSRDGAAEGWNARRWSESRHFGVPAQLEVRAAALGLDRAAFLAMVGSESPLASDWRPAWVDGLVDLLSGPPIADDGHGWPGLMQVAQRLLDYHLGMLRRRVDAIVWPDGLEIDWRALEPGLARALCERLAPRILQVLALELNIARVEGRLEGTTSEDRYASFLRTMRAPRDWHPFWRTIRSWPVS